MKFRRLVLAAAAFAAAPALVASAQDPPPGPGKSDPPAPAAPSDPGAKPAPPAKKERKADAKAVAVFEKYAKAVATPAQAGVKDAKCRIDFALPQLGGETIVLIPHWSSGGKYECEVELPESLAAQIPPEFLGMMKKQLSGQFGDIARMFLGSADERNADYDLEYSEESGKPVVKLTAFAEKAEAESSKAFFGADGLIEKTVTTPKVDPNDPQSQMMAGVEIETTFKHEKLPKGYVVSALSTSTPMGQFDVAMKYHDGPDGLPLAKAIEISSPMLPEPLVMTVYDYVLDGKAIASTAKPKTEKPATPAPDAPKADDAPKAPVIPDSGETPGPGK